MAEKKIAVGSYTRTTKSGKKVRVRAYTQSRDVAGELNALIRSDPSRPNAGKETAAYAGGRGTPSTSDAMAKAQDRVRAAAKKAAEGKAPAKKAAEGKAPAKKSDAPAAKKAAPKADTKKSAEAKPEKGGKPDSEGAPAAKKAAEAKPEKRTRDSFSEQEKKAREGNLTSRIDEVMKDGDTQKRHARIVKTQGPDGQEVKTAVYSPERAQMHREIISSILTDARARGVPRDGKAIMTGGLPGAGKSFIMQNKLGIDTSQYITINPDDFKEEIAKRSVVPGTEDGQFSPLEMAAVLHEESSDVSKMAREVVESMGYNVILDVTMGGAGEKPRKKHRGTVEGLRERGYEVRGVFVDIPHKMSAESAADRYWGGVARWMNGEDEMGGRYVPSSVAGADVSERGFNSSNRDNFENAKDLFSEFSVVDNSDRTRTDLNVLDEGGGAEKVRNPTNKYDQLADPISWLDSLLTSRREMLAQEQSQQQQPQPGQSDEAAATFADLMAQAPGMTPAQKVAMAKKILDGLLAENANA